MYIVNRVVHLTLKRNILVISTVVLVISILIYLLFVYSFRSINDIPIDQYDISKTNMPSSRRQCSIDDSHEKDAVNTLQTISEVIDSSKSTPDTYANLPAKNEINKLPENAIRSQQDIVKKGEDAQSNIIPQKTTDWVSWGFMVPQGQVDQYGNPVEARDDKYIDPLIGLPYEVWLNEPRIEFVLIPAGEFLMGSTIEEEGSDFKERPLHRVVMRKPYYLAKYELTRKQWKALMGEIPFPYDIVVSDNTPVYHVNHIQCSEYLEKLNLQPRLNGNINLRFPTEEEWEYSCRAGTTSRFNTGDTEADLDKCAWYDRDGNKIMPMEVGKKAPNSWGLYDMHGNVYEWCGNVDYSYDGKMRFEEYQSNRGGCVYSKSVECRSAARSVLHNLDRNLNGLRILMEITR